MLVDKIIAARGFDADSKLFSDPKYYEFHDPFAMKGMAYAVQRLVQAKIKEDKVTIYGDYDCDGVTGTVVLKQGLATCGIDASYVIPNRLTDGYGLSIELLDKVIAGGCNLLVTVDCGITGKQQVEYLKSKGIDVIIIDHHLPDLDNLPDCIVVNPKQPGCTYPFKELCGCAVAFKVITAMVKVLKVDMLILKKLTDLVTLATIADVVPLMGENRSLVKYGTTLFRSGQVREGISLLVENAKLDIGKITATDIAFKVVPQINAIGRLTHAGHAAKLMLATNYEEAKVLANTLLATNTSRKEIQKEQLDEAISMIEPNANVNLIYVDGAHEGIVGILAGRIREMTQRPTFIFTGSEVGTIKASARSVEAVHLYNTVIECGADKLCLSFGGHGGSCGLSVEPEKFEELKDKLRKGFSRYTKEEFEYTEFKSVPISLKEVTIANIESLSALEPYGKDNPTPTFKYIMEGFSKGTVLGEKKNTGKIIPLYGNTTEVMIFNSDEETLNALFSDSSKCITMEVQLGLNTYKGNTKCQMIVKKILEVSDYVHVINKQA